MGGILIPKFAEGKHIEKNEDGKESVHEGYILKNCPRCKEDFLVARVSHRLVCGGKKCK